MVLIESDRFVLLRGMSCIVIALDDVSVGCSSGFVPCLSGESPEDAKIQRPSIR